MTFDGAGADESVKGTIYCLGIHRLRNISNASNALFRISFTGARIVHEIHSQEKFPPFALISFFIDFPGGTSVSPQNITLPRES